jgi:hypothetical protein
MGQARTPKYSQEQLIKFVIEAKTTIHRQGKVFSRQNYEQYCKSLKNLPSASTLVQRLGGWKQVKKIWY